MKGRFTQNNLEKLFGHGIFVSDGESWKFQRKTASRIFHTANLRDQFSSVFISLLETIKRHTFDPHVGQVLDFQDIMFKFTLDAFVQ